MTIRVYISTDKFKGGPAIFRSRLISAIDRLDNIKIVTDVNEKFDIQVYNHLPDKIKIEIDRKGRVLYRK